MAVPSFLKETDDKLIFNQSGELLYFVPEAYFTETKSSIAVVVGEYVSVMGVFDWALADESGKIGKIRNFRFPTIFLCKPSRIETMKNFSINETPPNDYRVLHFKKGDEAISDVNVPEIIDNVENFFRMMVVVENKLPSTIPYSKGHEYFPENMDLNASGYGLNMQLFGLIWSELCRDPKNLYNPFRLSELSKRSDFGYKHISVTEGPKFVSPYTSLTSQNWDEALMAAVDMSAKGQHKYSPLEKVVTG